MIYNLLNTLNLKNVDNGIDKMIYEENLLIILSSTFNQKIHEDKNNITINLGQCEYILKKEYNITNNDTLYILEYIYEEEGMKIPKVEYEIYYQFYNYSNLTKLNLNLCEGTKVEISILVKINDDIE